MPCPCEAHSLPEACRDSERRWKGQNGKNDQKRAFWGVFFLVEVEDCAAAGAADIAYF
jgi:hypothetical protein